jgi:hypothetical protein
MSTGERMEQLRRGEGHPQRSQTTTHKPQQAFGVFAAYIGNHCFICVAQNHSDTEQLLYSHMTGANPQHLPA